MSVQIGHGLPTNRQEVAFMAAFTISSIPMPVRRPASRWPSSRRRISCGLGGDRRLTGRFPTWTHRLDYEPLESMQGVLHPRSGVDLAAEAAKLAAPEPRSRKGGACLAETTKLRRRVTIRDDYPRPTVIV